MTTVTDLDAGQGRWKRARLTGVVLLGLIALFVQEQVTSGAPAGRTAVVCAGYGLFSALYLWVVWRNTPVRHANQTPYGLGLAVLVGAGLVPLAGPDWIGGLALYTLVMLFLNTPRRYWPAVIVGVPAVQFLAGLLAGLSLRDAGSRSLPILLAGIVQAAFYTQVDDKLALRAARAELARLAVSEERLRIARDLHDLLGQRLSAMALKSELAGRLVRRDPDRAAAEMTEVGGLARAALHEVRETVSGYRTTSLTGEIDTAQALLAAAGLAARVSGPRAGLPAAAEECAAWVVREATTNVVRHARASRCEIVVTRSGDGVVVEVRDDGVAASAARPVTPGNGLRGLDERVRAAGGALRVAARDDRFVVRVDLPA